MKNLIEKMNEYIFKNEKPTYYRVKNNLTVEKIEPSFVFELIFFDEVDMAENVSKECVITKEKKMKRQTKLDTKTISDRLFRSLVNKDKYHSFFLANELMLKDKNILFDILYKLSYMAEDENKLIKTYLFEHITKNIGYREYILKNLIGYFTHSCPKYMDINDKKQMKYFYSTVSKLYVRIYNEKYEDKLDFEGSSDLSCEKKTIYNKLYK